MACPVSTNARYNLLDFPPESICDIERYRFAHILHFKIRGMESEHIFALGIRKPHGPIPESGSSRQAGREVAHPGRAA